jgi:hypothetical protein
MLIWSDLKHVSKADCQLWGGAPLPALNFADRLAGLPHKLAKIILGQAALLAPPP